MGGIGIDASHPWRSPRLTGRVFSDLAVWMVGFGVVIGLLFPFAVIAVGVPAATALRPGFFAATLVAGLAVGVINHGIARSVVGQRLTAVSERMRSVSSEMQAAAYSDDWERCDPDRCALPQDSDDELGDVAASFNHLLRALAESREVAAAHAAYAHTLAEHLDLDELGAAALDAMLGHVEAQAGTLLVADAGQLRTVATHRLDAVDLASSPILRHTLAAHETALIDVPDGLLIDAAVVSFRPAAVAVVPIELTEVPVAVLVLAFASRPTSGQLGLLERLRDPTSVALNNALAHERFQRLAAIDPLTGAYNRRFGAGRLAEEFARSVRAGAGAPLGLLSFDLDHFKLVNDTHGHLVGDQVLRRVVDVARSVLRAGDVLVRSGGEEFLAILPGSSLQDVIDIGERLRHAIRNSASTSVADGTRASVPDGTPVEVSDGAPIEVPVTISLGALSFPGIPADTPDDLLEVVDQALYRSKRDGRDRLTAHRPVPAV